MPAAGEAAESMPVRGGMGDKELEAPHSDCDWEERRDSREEGGKRDKIT